ncbi:MAG TPA: hypothetical protein VF172_06890 [Nitrososphaera sp.]
MRANFHLPYRQIEGAVRVHVGSKVTSVPNDVTISRRVDKPLTSR